MKQVTCQHCDRVFEHNDKNLMLGEMLQHYQTEHAEVMANLTNEIKAAWMSEFERRWNAG